MGNPKKGSQEAAGSGNVKKKSKSGKNHLKMLSRSAFWAVAAKGLRTYAFFLHLLLLWPPSRDPNSVLGNFTLDQGPGPRTRYPHSEPRHLHSGTRPPHSGTRRPHSGNGPSHSGTRPPHSGTRHPQSGTRHSHSGARHLHSGTTVLGGRLQEQAWRFVQRLTLFPLKNAELRLCQKNSAFLKPNFAFSISVPFLQTRPKLVRKHLRGYPCNRRYASQNP